MPPSIGHWNIEYWKNHNGNSQVEEFLNSMDKKQSRDRERIEAMLERLKKDWTIDLLKRRKDYLEYVREQELWELKFSVYKREFRMLGMLVEGPGVKPTYFSLYAFWKKDQKIRKKAFDACRPRLHEFKS